MDVISGEALEVWRTDGWERDLIRAAIYVREEAYAPYSKFAVGAAVMCGTILGISTGSNVENAMYEGAHAEEAALIAYIAKWRRVQDLIARLEPISAIAVALVAEDEEQHALPCGYCRQWIREFGTPKTAILGAKLKKNGSPWAVEVTTLGELLPFDFGPQNLAPA